MALQKIWKNLPVLILMWMALAPGALISVPLHAQVVGATVSGSVIDTSRSVVPQTQISIKNVETATSRDVEVNSDGFYTAPNLLPGVYDISASAPGFTTEVRTGITLTIGAQQVVNFTLQVGPVNQKIEVAASAIEIQLASSAIGGLVSSNTIVELPLNGRDWTQLATLQPGVGSMASVQRPAAASQRASRGFGTQLTISGGRPQQNNYRVDGITVNDYANDGPGNVLGIAMGVDAIAEFSVVSSNYSAEYGRTSGGVINAITRSGTNQLHGTVYEFVRNSAFDARNFFDAPQIPPFRRNQFGASGGAPIWKDKTFIFADYEGLRQSLGNTVRANVPSPDARNGIIHNADGTTTTLTVDPKVAAFLAIYALPNAGLKGAGNTGVYSFVSQQVSTANFETARIDHHFSEKDVLFGTYAHDSSDLSQPDILDTVLVGNHTANQRVALEETHIFNTRLINSVRFGFNRVHNETGIGISAINPAAADPALGIGAGRDAPQVAVSGLTRLNEGLNSQALSIYPWNTFQGYDDASLTFGKHNLKFGGGVERDQDNETNCNNSCGGGSFQFGSLTAFLLNKPGQFKTASVAQRHFRETILGAYIQDDVRWRPNVTINLGLRYEMSRVPTETNNELANLYNPTDATLHLGNPLWNNPTLRNLEPRVGFAWDPFGDGKTSVRSAFGIFDVLPLLFEFSGHNRAAPFSPSSSSNNLPAGTFPVGALALATANPLQETQYLGQNPKRNYIMQWNLSVQRELTQGLTLTATYLGSRGVHNPFTADDMNMVLPISHTAAGYLWPNPATNPQVINPNWGQIDYLQWSSGSFYHALEAQVTKRFSHGFEIDGAYTWSKSIDLSSGSGVVDPFVNSLSNLFFFENDVNRGVSDFNVKHNLVINFLWTAPKPHFNNGVADRVLGGWQLGGIFQTRTGLPFTPLIDGDPLNTMSSAPGDFPNRLAGSGCASAVNSGNVANYINLSCFGLPMATPAIAAQCVPFSSATVTGTCQNLQGNSTRNSLIGPGLTNLDFSLFKNNYFGHSERFNIQFRAEFFNILNHPNFDSPIDNSTLFDQNGAPVDGAGAIDATSTASRQIQFALKLIW
jgi:outer membrane receptor protein involved in Fe transport